MSNIDLFKEMHPSEESYWRSIILFGNNVASYKFAFAKTLLEMIPQGKTYINLNELAIPYSKHLCEHIQHSPKQITSKSSQFLEACKTYNRGGISQDELIAITVQKGFNNVVDAFHIVNSAELSVRFYHKDYQGNKKRIILSDDLYKLSENKFFNDLLYEVESRWNLVETSWGLGVSRNLLKVEYDGENKRFYIDKSLERKSVTSARDALNGYQKGKCFYCFDDITITGNEENLCDVDHFYPHMLQTRFAKDLNLNGVWNLVLACKNCNRGKNGKLANAPERKYLARLHKRNEFLISSHHPLRETLMNQTGQSEGERISFLKERHQLAIDNLQNIWGTVNKGEEVF